MDARRNPTGTNPLTRASARFVDDDDVTWVLGHAGWHIIEAGEDGQAVYRLAHQALADHYHDKSDETETQGRIVDALGKGVQGADWFNCDKYLWRHLADHSAKAYCIDDLISDPGYLSVADPARLVLAFPRVKTSDGHRLAEIYERAVDRLIDRSPVERMSVIHMMAQMEDRVLAPALEPPVPTQWRCRWARVKPSSLHRVIGRYRSQEIAITFGVIDGLPMVVFGTGNDICRCEARTGRPIGTLIEGHTKSVTALALGAIDGAPVIISGSWDNTIRRWDARTGDAIGKPIERSGRSPSWVGLGDIDGASIIFSLEGDNIHQWDARTGDPVGAPLEPPTGLSPYHFTFDKGLFGSVTLGAVDGAPMIVAGSWDGTIRRWDARTGKLIGNSYGGGPSSIAFGTVGGAPIIISSARDRDKTVRRWDARTGEALGKPLEGHGGPVHSVAFGMIDGTPVIVSGGPDNTIRRWDARTGAPIGQPLGGPFHRGIKLVAFAAKDYIPIIVSLSGNGAIHRWDARTGEAIGTPLVWRGPIEAAAVGAIDGALALVSVIADGTIQIMNMRTLKEICFNPTNKAVALIKLSAAGELVLHVADGLIYIDLNSTSW
jgi:WD40 repeat protein